MKRAELENRLIDFSVTIIKLTKGLPLSQINKHLSGQLIRSGTSPALNYGEAQSAESLKDFIHKLQIVLKELRESFVILKIIDRANLYNDKPELDSALNECNQLISIFVKSVQTAHKRNK
ncbi:MAG: four helix bundle protein [Balneola sp.]|jgi:four helix bundle protein|nr:four helix bundle protein [Balneola sp.]MBE78990.1 four helix bundle protein [Balneola sp.]HBX65804.1 four helix bundle protein [Balneolaceae bacterium]|tara:strand:- start:1300 stop:1659 length:360 start_codon:yes stop_codon:yes gene_type:complete